MSVAIRITEDDVKLMTKTFGDLDLSLYLWFYSKQINVFADKEEMVAGWYVLGVLKSRTQ